ncbi:uncharacterized protein LOC142635308 [Castanea sativa]|uniref:uncharacterized protein LOC142635308 n=1 Tax=Castanea sativa TaxID=21020 RepID=UPI003F650B5E
MKIEAESDDQLSDLPSGEIAMKLSGNTKARIRSQWANALIVKVFGKTVGYNYLRSRVMGPSSANLSSWIRLPELPIEDYDHSVLREIGEAIGLVLRIDTHTAAEFRGRFARLCVQANLDKPIVRLLNFGGIDQRIQYEGISSLCFACGWVGHKVETCPYKIRTSSAEGRNSEENRSQDAEECTAQDKDSFGPWVLVTRKKQQFRKVMKDQTRPSHLGSLANSPINQNASSPLSHALGLDKAEINNREGKRKPNEPIDNCAPYANNSVETFHIDKPNHVISLLKDNKILTRFGTPIEAIVKQFALRASETSDTTLKEFKAKGSSSSLGASCRVMALGEKMDQDSGVNECEQSVKTNLMSIEGEDKMISSAYSDHGPCLEVVSASITNYPLRRIDPKLRPGNMGGERAIGTADRLPFDGAIFANTIGLTRGLWLLWDSAQVDIAELSSTEQEIHVVVTPSYSNNPWLLSAIYASPRYVERRLLWETLEAISGLHSLPWVIAGDFNEVLIGEDKFGGRPVNINKALRFQECLDSCRMIDIGYSGPRYTRSNNRPLTGLNQERIDRVFVNADWNGLYLEAHVRHLERSHSNHCQVLLILARNQGISFPCPFRFQLMWLSHSTFPVVVRDAWMSPTVLAQVVSNFETKVTEWNKNVFANLFYHRKRIIARLKGVQAALSRNANDFLVGLEKDLRANLNEYPNLKMNSGL